MPNAPTHCPGPCNRNWRRDANTTPPQHLTPTLGEPGHCHTCQHRTRQDLAQLPELIAAIWLEAARGTARPTDVTTTRPAGIAPWPGQASRLLTDLIVGGLTELEDDIRDLRHLQPRVIELREAQTITRTIDFLDTHLAWAMAQHPAASEIHEQGSANPAAQIRSWHRMAVRFTRRDSRLEQRAAPCKHCGWRALFFADGEDYIECRNPNCETLMTESEYQDWAREVAAEHSAAATLLPRPAGGSILGAGSACPEAVAAA